MIDFLKRMIGQHRVRDDNVEQRLLADIHIKLCVNCKHCAVQTSEYENVPFVMRCKAPQNLKFDLVTGDAIPRFEFCATHRELNHGDACSKDGNWFEQKAEIDKALP